MIGSDNDNPRFDNVRQVEATLETLNARIARLCLTLGVHLDSDADVEHLLERDGAEWAKTPGDSAMARRRQQALEELRGLFVVRCDLMSHTLHSLGPEVTFQIVKLVEEQLLKEGFAPGADGFELYRRMKAQREGAGE